MPITNTYDVPQLPPAPTRYPSKTGRPYKFDYNIADHEGNQQYRIERADAQNTKTGAYGYRDVNGVFRHVNYIADRYGFRAVVNTNEPGTAPMDSADVVFNAAPIKVLPVKAPQHTVLPKTFGMQASQKSMVDATASGTASLPLLIIPSRDDLTLMLTTSVMRMHH
ncbi:hypothetical protein HPB52_024814 [Rhipicephalus sanguineus]|uniref:Cuticle protein n=1 Tax=Rhipicephalus sanguineus TaxID=34632 RepID=A0A9D4YRV5_RHISA|nr:hypothetical protein HPB52_024814 [Rhipicephalus sanguineus]